MGHLFLYASTIGAIAATIRLTHICTDLRRQWGATPLWRIATLAEIRSGEMYATILACQEADQ